MRYHHHKVENRSASTAPWPRGVLYMLSPFFPDSQPSEENNVPQAGCHPSGSVLATPSLVCGPTGSINHSTPKVSRILRYA